MTNDYINAKNLLPPELLAEVQKFCSGLVWIPAPNRQSGRKRRIATQMLRTGMTSGDIRKLMDISPRHLRRLAREVHAEPPSPHSAASDQ